LPTYDTTATIAKALATRPEMRSIESQQNIAELSRKSVSEQRLPQLEFSGHWLYQGEHFSEAIPAYSYLLGLEIPHLGVLRWCADSFAIGGTDQRARRCIHCKNY
jgi:hypothetical protein